MTTNLIIDIFLRIFCQNWFNQRIVWWTCIQFSICSFVASALLFQFLLNLFVRSTLYKSMYPAPIKDTSIRKITISTWVTMFLTFNGAASMLILAYFAGNASQITQQYEYIDWINFAKKDK